MEVKNIEPLIVMCKTGYLPPPSPNNVESLERWMQAILVICLKTKWRR